MNGRFGSAFYGPRGGLTYLERFERDARFISRAEPGEQDQFIDFLFQTPDDPRELRRYMSRNISAQKAAQKNKERIE